MKARSNPRLMSVAKFLALVSRILRVEVEGKPILNHLPHHLKDEVLEGMRSFADKEEKRLKKKFDDLDMTDDKPETVDIGKWFSEQYKK